MNRICQNCGWFIPSLTEGFGECFLDMEGKKAGETCLGFEEKEQVNDLD